MAEDTRRAAVFAAFTRSARKIDRVKGTLFAEQTGVAPDPSATTSGISGRGAASAPKKPRRRGDCCLPGAPSLPPGLMSLVIPEQHTTRPRIYIAETACACGKCIPYTQKAFVRRGCSRVLQVGCYCWFQVRISVPFPRFHTCSAFMCMLFSFASHGSSDVP